MVNEIIKAVEVLKSGGTILYPTDTIWGLGCDPTNSEAVNKIFEIKQREDTKSMLVLVNSIYMLSNYIMELPNMAEKLIETTDKPLTIIYDQAINLAPNLISSDGSIGIRLSRDEFTQGLIKNYKKPVVSTSANISGKKPPRYYSEIDNKIINAVDYVVNWRKQETTPSVQSGIIKLGINGEIKIIRE
ncbi:L-threonylcarbamoyladenylate synthase [Bacteroidota bacterium]